MIALSFLTIIAKQTVDFTLFLRELDFSTRMCYSLWMPHKLSDLCPSTTIREIVAPTALGWSAFNPSIAQSPSGYACIVRSSNYSMDTLGRYVTNDPDGYIRTVNYFCALDDDLAVTAMLPIEDTRVTGEVLFPLVQGMEDARLYWSKPDKMWHAYGTVRYHREDGNCEIAEDRITRGFINDPTIDCVQAIDRTIYPAPVPGRPEKNWAILPDSGTFVYSFNPLEVYHASTGQLYKSDDRADVGEVRGSSQVVAVTDSRLLSVVHAVYYPNNSFAHRAYEHRFVDVVGDKPVFSKPFYLHGEGIEFVAGIAGVARQLCTLVWVQGLPRPPSDCCEGRGSRPPGLDTDEGYGSIGSRG